MATKLKNLKVKKVDFVDDGANPKAHIRLFKSKDGEKTEHEQSEEDGQNSQNVLERLAGAILKAFTATNQIPAEEAISHDGGEIAKGGSESFSGKILEIKNRKICDEVWDVCYALQSSFCSILNDEELDSTGAANAMAESLSEFTGVVQTAIGEWSAGKITGIRKAGGTDEEPETENTNKELEGETDMSNIDKSKLTEAERAFLESIEKRYGAGTEETTEVTQKTDPAVQEVTNPVEKSAKTDVTPESSENGGTNNIYKGLHPAVAAELEALKKFKESAEERELTDIARKYEIIGKKKEDLVPVLKNLKAAGGTAYADMIAVLDSAVDTVTKSAAFTEIGKSGSAGTTNGEAWAKAEAQAADIMKSKNITKAQALDEVFINNPELAAECEQEG